MIFNTFLSKKTGETWGGCLRRSFLLPPSRFSVTVRDIALFTHSSSSLKLPC